MNTFVTHPSVRIKGTENTYTPTQCFDVSCPNKVPHMHCPFCIKTDCYQDPVILKAHYRVKHVDKGIEFAGLKIVRCCDHCDIVGVIKGEKKFKGAHWHCYKCRNGFNRRDEAVKHYKTHFRNPQTTFQIQIAQEVNQPVQYNDSLIVSEHEAVTIHPALTEAVTCMASSVEEHDMMTGVTTASLSNCKTPDGTVHVSVAANETVEASGQTIMIIQEDQLDTSTVDDEQYTTQVITSEDVTMLEEKIDLEKKIEELHQKCHQLEIEKLQMEEQLKREIQHLKTQLQDQEHEITAYQKRERELMTQLSIPLDKGIQDLLHSLEEQHRDLLRQQLAFVRRTYLLQQSLNQNGSNNSISVQTPSLASENQIIIIQNEDSSNKNDSSVAQLPGNLTNSNIVVTQQPASENDEVESIKIVTVDTVEVEQRSSPVGSPVNNSLKQKEIMEANDGELVESKKSLCDTEPGAMDDSAMSLCNDTNLSTDTTSTTKKKADFEELHESPKRKKRL